MDDGKIIDLFYERSEQAIFELSEKYGSFCRKIALNILKNERDAEECVNDALLAVWNTVPPQKPDPLPSYLSRIVRNTAVKRYCANTAEKRNSHYDLALDELEDCIGSRVTVEDEFDARETARALNEFLETLDKKERILFVRRYWRADSIEDLSALFHTSRHNISVRLSRTRKKLKAFLLKKGVSP